ncbi:MAG TPA: alpha-L-arabinofuranosidase C-terminal domain-containing protein [Candidatus Synoicihabitans sp.]|nr:alpha-L-arabinofuranosidase C-terminal domain-containing protein [Candidatus Synoicihabitans sp.]
MARLRTLIAFASLLALSARAEPTPLPIDPAKTGAPINPFIYGQFIEHLGRCIYGGIWSEMLEDRKFYFPIKAEYAPYRAEQATAGTADFPTEGLQQSSFPALVASPWQIIGATDSVTMTTEDAFVGAHTPLVRVGAGVRHHNLGTVADLDYVGYVWGRPQGDRSAVIEVVLAWGEGPTQRASTRLSFPPGGYTKQEFRLRSGGRTDGAVFELKVSESDVLIGTASLMPGDNVRGMRRDTLALLKELGGTIYRWPGGNFVSGYDWRDGIGDRDRRPPRGNPAWTGVEHNDFGTDEFLDFCREIQTEPMIAVNTGFGDDYSAAQWVQYVNGRADSLVGGWRAMNGHRDPYGVKYWCVGNEMWGPFQLGWMQLHHYVLKHNRVARAMRAVDPSVKLVGVGDIEQINREHDPEQTRRNVSWTEGMLLACGDNMDMISEHFYVGRRPWTQEDRPDTVTHIYLVREAIKKKADLHRKLQPMPHLDGRIVPIAMDEWNYWHRTYQYGELGCIYDLSDGIGIAAGLHEFYRQSDLIPMAHYAQTVNVIGAIKTSRTEAEFESTGLVLKLYRHHYGQIPLQVDGRFGDLDVAAALTEDRRALTVSVINPTTRAQELQLQLAGNSRVATGERWHITGENEFVHNSPGQPRQVDIHHTPGIDATRPLAVPAMSTTLFSIPLQ